MASPAAVLEQIDVLLRDFERVVEASPYDDLSGGMSDHDKVAVSTRLMAGIRRLSPPGSDYVRRAEEIRGHEGYVVQQLGGILLGLRADVEAGYMQSFAELVHADVFADFLEMASELQEKGFKDAAAVVAGSVLEEHLRKLAAKTGVTVGGPDGSPKKADALNADLAREEIYNKLVQKSVTAWLDLRNNAAHGRYDQYDHAQVAALIRDVRELMIRHPA
jgi:hypothetical protein